MNEQGEQRTGPQTESSSGASYCPDRRTAVSAIALAIGGVAVGAFAPSPAWAKAKKVARVPKKYPIIYRLNGGVNPKKQVKTVTRGVYAYVSRLKKPTRKGYTFVGWYSDKALKRKARVVLGRSPKAKRTLYAKWKACTYGISYVLNGGSFPSAKPTKYKPNSKEIALPAPIRKGYRFAGWFSDASFKKPAYSIKAGSTGNKKFYAKWELETYSIGYSLAGGVATLALPTNFTVQSSRITPAPPMRDGFRFAGWYGDAGLIQQMPYVKPGSAGNVTFYAKWEPVSYWDAHLAAKCARVNELAATGPEASDWPSSGTAGGEGTGAGDGGPGTSNDGSLGAAGSEGAVSSFVFITDMHIPSNALVSPYLVKRVMQQTDASMVVFGGDAINGQTNRADALAMLQLVRNSFAGSEVHFVRGNHDANNEGSNAVRGNAISAAEYIGLTAGSGEVREPGSLDYYRDDADRKVRYIFMDTGAPNSAYVSTLQLSWLKKRVKELGEGWTVLVFAHQFYAGGLKYDANGTRIRKALDSIYDSSKAQIAGVISGHVHRDHAVFSDKGYPMVSTLCDAHPKSAAFDAVKRKPGTTTEQAFDVVTLDTRKKMLYFTRIGAGKDRSFRYAEPASSAQAGSAPAQALRAAAR